MSEDTVNPLKSDPELQVMLKQVDSIKKYHKFQKWKNSFLERLEKFLSQSGMNPATRSATKFEESQAKYLKIAGKISGLINSGGLTHTSKNVKATMGLNEMGNILQGLIQDLKDLLPGLAAEEKKQGYTKFHLGAVLIRQGFHQYISMQAINEVDSVIEEKAGGSCDSLLLSWFEQYKIQVQRFCDVMADLGLYGVMMAAIKFQDEPDDESIDPDPINITIKTHDGKTITLELDPRETVGNVKDAIAPGCEMEPERQVLKFEGRELDDNGNSLENEGIPDGAVLTVEPLKIPIKVKTIDGKILDMMIDPEDPIQKLKEDLEPKTGLPPDNQKLKMNGLELTDPKENAIFYGIKPGQVLELEPKAIKVNVEMPDGTVLQDVELGPLDSGADVKKRIEDETGFAAPRQVLNHNGNEFPDTQTVFDKGIQNGDTIQVETFKVPVIVRTMDGTEIPVQVDPTAPLLDIKQEVEPKSGVPASNQELYEKGALLDDDDKPAGDYGIKPGTVLDMQPKTMTLNVDMPDGSQVQVDITPKDTSQDIKDKIEAKTGLEAPRQVLKKLGEELPEGKSAKDMGLRDQDNIQVDLFKVPVIVRTMDGREIPVMVDPGDKLRAIKDDVADEAGIPSNNQNLYKGGDLLDNDNKKAGDYGIKAGDVLDLEPKNMSLNVTMPDGSKIAVDITPADTSADIKKKIEDKSGLEAPRQVLKKLGEELPEGTTAKDMGLKDNDDIDVDIYKVPIIVRTMDGREIPTMVDLGDKLRAIKEDVADEAGVHPDKQALFKDGTLLGDNNKKAGDYGIKEGDILDLEPTNMVVNVTMPDGSQVPIDITPDDTANNIKQKIQDKTGLEVPRQVLSNLNGELPDGKSARDMGLQDGDDLNVDIKKVPVQVRTMDGKQIPVMVDPTQPLRDIKKDVEDEAGVPADNQNLFKDGSLLDNDDTPAGDYGIQEGTVLDLEPKKMTVNVEMPDSSQVPIEISPRDTSDDIKNKIEAKTGMPVPTQVLKKNGLELPEGKTAKDMGIRDNDNLKVDVFKVPVTVNNYDGKVIEIMVDPTESLGNIKDRLEPESGIPAHNQQLSMGGSTLPDDGKTAGDYGIQAGSVLDLCPKSMAVNIELPDGKKIQVDLSPSDTAEDIKRKVETKSGLEVPRQVLKMGAKELPDNKRAVDMGVRDGSDLKVDIFKIPIEVHTMDGEEHHLMIDPTQPLYDIKKEVEPHCGIPPHNQKLFMDGMELAGDKKAAKDHGIEKDSILYMEPSKLVVSILMPDESLIELELSPWDTADDIKDKVANQTGLHSRRQVLSKRYGNELPNGKPAKDIPLQDGDQLKIELYKIPLIVQDKETERKFPIEVEPYDDTIDQIKNIIQPECGIPAKKQILKYKNNELSQGNKAVDHYGIPANSVLVVENRMDAIIFVDIKCNSLFAVDREDCIEGEILTAPENKLNFTEASTGPAAKENLREVMMRARRLGVNPQVVVEGMEVEDYDIEEAEAVKDLWGVTLKKKAKNKKGEEFLFIDPKTGAFGELSRRKYLDMGFMTPIKSGPDWTLKEAEPDPQLFDKYISDIRGIFGIKSAK